MSFLTVEDSSGSAEIIVFPKTFAKVEAWLNSHTIFVIKGVVDTVQTTQCKIKAQETVPIELVLSQWPQINYVSFTLPTNIDDQYLQNIKSLFLKGSIPVHFLLNENGKTLRLKTKEKIALDTNLAQVLESNGLKIECAL